MAAMTKSETLLLTLAPPFTPAGQKLLDLWSHGSRVCILHVEDRSLANGDTEVELIFRITPK